MLEVMRYQRNSYCRLCNYFTDLTEDHLRSISGSFNANELKTTETLLPAIAAAAHTGLKRHWAIEKKTPAATGMSETL